MTAKQTTQLKPKARNGKPLMSELLTDVRKYIELAEQADVEPLRQFLFNEPERPLIAMGHGGSHSSAAYAALLYGTNCGLGRAITPYQAYSLSDATLKSAKLLLISKSVKNQDAVYIAKRMNTVNPDHSYIFKLPFDVPDGFISIGGTFAYFYIKPSQAMWTFHTGWHSLQSLPTTSPTAVSMESPLHQTSAPSRSSPSCTDHT